MNKTLPTVITLAVLTLGCGGAPSPGTAKPVAAAKVQAPKPEGELTTITLTPESEAHLALKTAAAAMENVAPTRTVGGEAVVPAGKSIVVTAPVAGTITAPANRAVTLGPIERNGTIIDLLPLQQTEREALIEADRAASEADARLTEVTQRLQRLEGLLKEGSASTRSVEEARAAQTIAAAAVTAARQRVAAGRQLPTGPRGEIALKAPFDGVVTAVRVAPGQTVAAGAPVAEVAQVSTLWLRVPVYAGDLAALDTNAPASVAALGQESSGPWRQARRIQGPPTADATAASVDLFYELPNAGAVVRPGERLSVRLALKSSEQALIVPKSAVVYDIHGGAWVYELKAPHVYARRRVEISGPAGANLVVRRGLTPGVTIVIVGAAELFGTEFYVSK